MTSATTRTNSRKTPPIFGRTLTGGVFGNDLLEQPFGGLDLLEGRTQQLLACFLARQPAGQFLIDPRQRQGFTDFRILPIRGPGSVLQQNDFGFVARHGFGGWLPASVNNCCNLQCKPSSQPRFDGADWHLKYFGDLFVGMILEIKKGHRGLIYFIHFSQRSH